MNPIVTPHVEIVKDMHKYSREFPTQIIPHTSENGVVDLIHNYTRPKPKEDATGRISINALDSRTPNLTEEDIAIAQREITRSSTAKLVGLICHLSYWIVFGHLNPLPLDKFHLKQLFISIA